MPPKAKGAKAKGAKLPEGRTCAVCGVPAANTCGGCHQVTYCSADHQRQHWKSGGHKAKCAELKQRAESARAAATGGSADSTASAQPRLPIDAPAVNATANLECHGCGKTSEGMKVCSKCKFAKYCSVECQRESWRRHKKRCPSMRGSIAIYHKVMSMDCVVCLQPMTALQIEADEIQILDCGHHLHVACWVKVNTTAAAANVCPVCRKWYQPRGQAERVLKGPHWTTWSVNEVVWTLLGFAYQVEAVERTGDPEGAPLEDEIKFNQCKIETSVLNGSFATVCMLLDETMKVVRRLNTDVDAVGVPGVPHWIMAAMVFLAGPEKSEARWIRYFVDWWGPLIPKDMEIDYVMHDSFCENPLVVPGVILEAPLPGREPL